MTNVQQSVGELAASRPLSILVYKKFGIDFCCGGGRSLATALEEKAVSAEDFFRQLELVEKEREAIAGRDFREMGAEDLSHYIEDTHHTYLRHALPEIADLLQAVIKAHGKNHRELFEVYRLYGQLKADLEQHLVKEENMLFPDLIAAGEDVRELAEEIMREHEAAGELLTRLHEVTNHYAIPDDACPTYVRTYEKLLELEDDLHQHIHLENNILLKSFATKRD